MPKPSFNITLKDGAVKTVLYSPLSVTVGGVKHRLALHRGPGRDWMISEPESSGVVVPMVYGLLLGRPDSGKRFKLSEIRPLALNAIELLVSRHGAACFNERLAAHARRKEVRA